MYGGLISGFEREQDDYYDQLNRSRKQRGLEVFKQFSTLNQYAPNYMPAAQQEIVVPAKPNMAASLDAATRLDEANQNATQSQLNRGINGAG